MADNGGEPLLTRIDGPPDPLDDVVRDEGVRMAALVVLERLTPEQRVAFVLHDALAVPFAEIADVLGCSVTTARQHASRARCVVAEADPPPRVGLDEQHVVLEEFLAALAAGDVLAVAALLHPAAATPVLVNGDLGLLFPAFPGDGAHPPLGRRVSCFAVRGGRIAAVYDVVNPDKLTRFPG